MDGRTLAPLVGGGGVWPPRRGVLDEINSGGHDYDAIRTPRFAYSELATGERELYDLHTDPYELHNRAGQPAYAGIQARLAARLDPAAPLLRDPGPGRADRAALLRVAP